MFESISHTSIFYIFEKELKIFIFLFQSCFFYLLMIVLLFLKRKVMKNQMQTFFYSYSIISFLFNQFGLVIKHNKLDVFHFSKSIKNINPSLLYLSLVKGTVFRPKDIWQYLGFFFDIKYSFWHYIHYYTNKALSTIKSTKILGNLTRKLSLIYKYLLYRTCVIYYSI